MAIMNEPGVRVALIDASGSGLMTRYDVVCIHTIVGHDPAPAAHMSFGAYGEITQSRDTRFRSAANLNGNYRVIAFECEDMGEPFPSWSTSDGHAVPSFTPQQCESIARALAWCHKTHGIPLVFVTDSRPTTRGVCFHRAGCDGNFAGYAFGGRTSGGELWSSVYGKVCPGDRRITQLRDTIIPRARVLAGLQEDVVDLTAQNLADIAAAVWNKDLVTSTGYRFPAAGWLMASNMKLDALANDEATIIAAIRDPNNPASADLVARILGGVTTLLEAHQDPDIVVGPEHVQAIAEAVVAALPAELRPTFEQAVASVLRGGTEEFPPPAAG